MEHGEMGRVGVSCVASRHRVPRLAATWQRDQAIAIHVRPRNGSRGARRKEATQRGRDFVSHCLVTVTQHDAFCFTHGKESVIYVGLQGFERDARQLSDAVVYGPRTYTRTVQPVNSY